MRLTPFALAALAACSNTAPETEVDSGPEPHVFDRPADVPEWAGDLMEDPEDLVIYALDPLPVSMQELPEDTPSFHGYRVLGTASLTNDRDRHGLVDRVWAGIADAPDAVAACFMPRHGIRAVVGQRWADFVICYECIRMHVYDENGERVSIGTANAVEPAVSALYRAKGLEIAAKK